MDDEARIAAEEAADTEAAREPESPESEDERLRARELELDEREKRVTEREFSAELGERLSRIAPALSQEAREAAKALMDLSGKKGFESSWRSLERLITEAAEAKPQDVGYSPRKGAAVLPDPIAAAFKPLKVM